jgi:hypothetical protein
MVADAFDTRGDTADGSAAGIGTAGAAGHAPIG